MGKGDAAWGSDEAPGGDNHDILVLIPALSVATDVTLNKSLSLSGTRFLKCNRDYNLNNSNNKKSLGCCEDHDMIQLDESKDRKAF